MKIIKVTIEGKTPLILNRFTEAAQMSASSGQRLSSNGDRGTPQDIAQQKLYLGADGKTLILPAPNLFSCVIAAGSFFKSGKSKITTQKSSLIPACVEFEEVELPIKHKQPWKVDSRPVRIPATGGRILAHRPMFDDWQLEFTANIDTDMITTGLFRDIIDTAGRRVGLGDFRPATKGPYGRFLVTHWKETN